MMRTHKHINSQTHNYTKYTIKNTNKTHKTHTKYTHTKHTQNTHKTDTKQTQNTQTKHVSLFVRLFVFSKGEEEEKKYKTSIESYILIFSRYHYFIDIFRS